MADPEYVAWVEPSCAPGTLASAYTTTAVDISTVLLHRMEVRIPAGHQGTTGIALIDSGAFVIPYVAPGAGWLIGDDDELSYTYERELGSNVKLATYNTGTFTHAWQVRLIYTPMSAVGTEEPSIEVVHAIDRRAIARRG